MRLLQHALMILIFCLAALPEVFSQGLVEARQAEVAEQAVVGRWEAPIGKLQLHLRFYEEGNYRLGDTSGRYEIAGADLRLTSAEGSTSTYQFELDESFLTLRGGDLGRDLRFVRVAGDDAALRGYYQWLFNLSFSTAEERIFRILTVLGIVALSVLFVNLLRLVSSFLIFSDFGPFRYIYRRHKVKTRTVHSVVLNFIKYIIYFTALGHVLAELGINYATYFASLSVVGLAVGFGSQGLVQDIVTGFFLIFDGQLGVGDMVEISGQTGVVEELGLRTTRLRNYMGQTVVIPNRNIAVVGNYSKGAVRAYLDVAVKDEASLNKMAGQVTTLLAEISKQFAGTVLTPPQDLGTLKLESGELFRRWVLDLWPQQHQVLLDQQVLPRVRELFARAGEELPHDRISVVYRIPEARPVSTWRSRLARKDREAGEGAARPIPPV